MLRRVHPPSRAQHDDVESRIAALGRGKRNHAALGPRRVAVVTGTRAEYGLLQSTMRAIQAHPRLRLQLIVTGMHLLRRFGRTIDLIRKDGWKIDATVPMQRGDDGSLDQAEGLARGIAGISKYLHKAKTDIVVVLGDRIEALAGALAAVTTGKLLAHIHGDDLAPGDLDDSFRHAITKIGHLHLAATPSAAERIVRMGENPDRVCCVGAPGLDRLRELLGHAERSEASPARRRLQNLEILRCAQNDENGHPVATFNRQSTIDNRKWTIDNRESALILHHPCGRSADHERRVMKQVLAAVDDCGLAATCIYPNSDRGHSGIIQAIEKHARQNGKNGGFRVVRSMDRDAYLRTLVAADVLVGNSSSGIIEAATAGTPAVNVGPRQQGREVSGDSVFHAEETLDSIRDAIRKALRRGPITLDENAYGDGRAGPRIAECLALVPLGPQFLRKLNAY